MAKTDEAAMLQRTLLHDVGRAIADFELVAEGDRIMVAMSGGKDSYALMHAMAVLRKRAPIRFELEALHLDQGQPGHDPAPLQSWLEERGIPHRIVREDTYSVVLQKVQEGKAYCSMCSRLRRGILYTAARDLGCTKIALGHHRDDAIETLLLNLLYSGQIKAMPPKLVSDDGCNVVIRPLIYAAEEDLARLAVALGFPVLPCTLCGSQPDLERQFVKRLLSDLEARHPSVRASMLTALTNVRPTHLLDRELWRSLGLVVAHADEDLRVSLTRSRSRRRASRSNE